MTRNMQAWVVLLCANTIMLTAFHYVGQGMIAQEVDRRIEKLLRRSDTLYEKDMKANGLRSVSELSDRIRVLEFYFQTNQSLDEPKQ